MRKLLDHLYTASGVLAAVFLVGIFAIVLAQVAANILDFAIAGVTGTAVGLVIPSYTDIAGFFLAAASFLALPYTFRRGAHIRVSLLLQGLPPLPRKIADTFSCLLACAICSYFAWYCWLLVLDSIDFGDVSPGLIPVPLWIPQAAMALGVSVLAIATADTAIRLIKDGRDPALESAGEGAE